MRLSASCLQILNSVRKGQRTANTRRRRMKNNNRENRRAGKSYTRKQQVIAAIALVAFVLAMLGLAWLFARYFV